MLVVVFVVLVVVNAMILQFFFLVAADSDGGFLYLFVFIENIHHILVGNNTIGITEPYRFDNETTMPTHNNKITDVNIGCTTNIAYFSKYQIKSK